ncbi:hypothetical protein Tco_0598064 [Tanacetum coccineum]
MDIMAENVIATGAENRPPMLENGMYDSWKSRILLYIEGKENGEMLIDSINNGPFQFKKEIIIPATEGTPEHKRPQELKDLTPEKKVKDSEWFKENMLLAQAQKARVILQEEQQDFLVDGLEDLDSDCNDLQLHTTSIFKANHVGAFDLDCDETPTASAIFMARLSHAGLVNGDDVNATDDSDILSKYMDTIENDVAQSIPPPEQNNDNVMILSKPPMLYNANVLAERHDPVFVCDSEETLILAEESRLKMKEKKEHDDKPIDYAKLNKLYEYFVSQQQLSSKQVYWSPVSKPIPPVPAKDHLDKFDECIKAKTVVNSINWENWVMDYIKDAYEE